jgi:hypothetical protein
MASSPEWFAYKQRGDGASTGLWAAALVASPGEMAAITTTSHARHALAYVLHNWRRHREDRRCEGVPIDRSSTGISFGGWRGSPAWEVPSNYDPLPVSPPGTWLLSTGWRRHGEIELYERPGPFT